MSIGFNAIPSSIRVPFTYVEFDSSGAVKGATSQPYVVLMMGQKLAAGTQDELTLKTVTTEAQALTLYGQGSMLHRMAKYYFANNGRNELKVIAIDDAGAGVAATGKIAVDAGVATADGTLKVYIAGQTVSVAVDESDDQDAVATALVAAITAIDDLPVTAAVNGTNANEVDLTAKHKGELGNDIDLRANYFDSDAYPAGISLTITAMASGATNPDVSEIIAALPEDQYIIIVNPWTDAANLALLETELADRAGPLRQNDGVAVAYKIDDLATLSALGNSRNSQYSTISTPAKSAPNPSYEWAAAKAGQVAAAGDQDKARPFQTLPLNGMLAPSDAERFSYAEREILLSDGIGTDVVAAGGVSRIERFITTYQKNAAGAADTSFLDANTVLILSYLRYDFRTQMQTKFPRHKLSDDGQRSGAGQPVLTPLGGKAEAIRIFRAWEELGLVEGAAQFASELVCERNSQDPNRLDFLLPTNVTNALRVMGAKINFIL